MICPRCSVADLPTDTHECPLCGFTPSANVLLEQVIVDEAREAVQQALADRFQIERVHRLGQRSFVYVARDLTGDREVVLKVIPVTHLVDHELAKRFERQAGLAASLRHAHIAPVLSYGVARSFLWYSMELFGGRSLEEMLRETGTMELESCLRIAEQVGSALDFAHRRGAVHGNLKPSNILVDDHGWVRVIDFGINEVFGRPRPARGSAPVLHLPEYLAPEQFYARTAGASADQYAFGVVVYECLAGSVPFLGDSFEEVASLHATEPPPRLSDTRRDLPVSVMEAVGRALSKHPAGRFPTVLDFIAALSGTPRPAAPHGVAGPTPPASDTPVLVVDEPTRRVTPARVTLGSVVLAIMIGVGVLLWQPEWLAWTAPLLERARSMVAPETARNAAPQEPQWETLDPVTQFSTPAAEPASTEAPPDPVDLPPPVTLRPAPPTESAAAPVQPGRLFVNASPWGELYIDGQLIGNTPKADLALSPGRHTIRVLRDGFEPYERQIEVGPGQMVRLTGIVLVPRDR